MEKFLIIKPSSLGDIVHGLQVIKALKDQRPKAHISWVVAEAFASLVEACACVDRVLIFQRKGGIQAFWKLIQTIREDHYEYVLDLQGLARTGLLTFLAKASHKLGRGDAREGAGLTYQEKTRNSTQTQVKGGRVRHAIDILMDFLCLLNLKPELTRPLAFKALPPLPYAFPSPPLLLFPNSRRPEKEWPYFTALTEGLIAHYPQRPILWLGQTPIPEPKNAKAGQFLNLISQTTLLQTLSLIQASALCITNDSGPMHMAAALQKPILALFGPTKPEAYGPYPLDCPQNTVLKAPAGDLSLLASQPVLERVKGYFKGKSYTT